MIFARRRRRAGPRIALCLLAAAVLVPGAAADPRMPRPLRGLPEPTLRLAFVGDIMTHPDLSRMADYGEIYQAVAEVFQASDLAFANLEFPVDSTRPASGYPLFNANREYVRAALDAGIDVLSTANNHAFDGREEGVFQTVRALVSLEGVAGRRLFFSGVRGNPRRAFTPLLIVRKGVRIGFIAVTQFLNQWGGGRYVDVVDYENEEDARRFEQLVKDTSPFYDVFVVSYHGDREYAQKPAAAKRAFFRRLAESGATIVWGHHPHVLQRYELVSVRGTQRLIMYSLGNFISGMAHSQPPDPDGLDALVGDSIILRADITVSAGGASVTALQPIPVGDYRKDTGGVVVLKLDNLADGVAPVWKSYFEERRVRIMGFLDAR